MILHGKIIKEEEKDKLKDIVSVLEDSLKFIIIQVGSLDASSKYISNKVSFAKSVGIDVELLTYKKDVSESELLLKIDELNTDKSVNGVIVQLPLPNHLDTIKVTQAIDERKDIDGFNTKNIGLTYLGENSLTSCTAVGVVNLLNYYKIPIEGQNITIAGRSNLIGKILALLLINLGATVSVCNSKTKDIKKYIDNSDIFISAVGRGKFFGENYFENSKDLTVIDIGTNFIDGKLVGDIDFENVQDLVKNITPVPGGIGQLTVLELLKNVVKAYELQKEEE